MFPALHISNKSVSISWVTETNPQPPFFSSQFLLSPLCKCQFSHARTRTRTLPILIVKVGWCNRSQLFHSQERLLTGRRIYELVDNAGAEGLVWFFIFLLGHFHQSIVKPLLVTHSHMSLTGAVGECSNKGKQNRTHTHPHRLKFKGQYNDLHPFPGDSINP